MDAGVLPEAVSRAKGRAEESEAARFRARENASGHGRLSPAHFAYLRAWAEGLDRGDAARRYLGLEHGHQLRTLHDQAVAHLRAVARRAGDSRWRLIGMDVGASVRGRPAASAGSALSRPTVAVWAAAQGYDDWSEAEQLALYNAAFSSSGAEDPIVERKLQRAARVRRRQLAVLAELERTAATAPRPTDPISGWFDEASARRLQRAGFVMLGELQQAIRAGGRWWRAMPGIGLVKAARIAAFVDHLLPAGRAAPEGCTVGQAPRFAESAPTVQLQPVLTPALPCLAPTLDGSAGSNRALRPPTIAAQTDLQAIRSWVAARARSPRTAAVYEREALRWMLWCALERDKPMSSAGPDDCIEYMRFLQRIPVGWIHRGQRTRLADGWTPFRRQLGLAARRLAVKVLHLMCAWLVEHGRYLDANPWAAVNRALVDGSEQPAPRTSRALTVQAYTCLVEHAQRELDAGRFPAAARNRFIVVWLRHTGLRASELLAARIGDLRTTAAGWLIRVVGKGTKPRDVSVPSPAVRALGEYLASRGLPTLDQCGRDVPLTATARGEADAPHYSAIHASFAAFVRRAMRASNLPPEERDRAARATQHWLRHTYATRFAEASGPQDVLMAELGHSDPSTTATYYTAQIERRQAEVERAAT